MPAGQKAKCLAAAPRWVWLAQSPAAPPVGPRAFRQAGKSWVVSRSSKRGCLTPRSTSGPGLQGHKGLGAVGTAAQLSCLQRFLSTNVCLTQLPTRDETTGTSWHSPTLPWPQPLEKRFRVPTQGQQEPAEGLCAPLLISETHLTPCFSVRQLYRDTK